jgi:hypothetical protein
MSELELQVQLRRLGAAIEYPPTPDLASRVHERLAARRPGRLRLPRRRTLAVALALIAIAVGVAFAVPPARTAILRFFHIGAVTVERVDTLPQATGKGLAAGLGRPLPLAEAERRAGFHVLLPPAANRPRRAYYLDGLLAVLLSVPTHEGKKPVLLAEIRDTDYGIAKKAAGLNTKIEPVHVNGGEGIWMHGAPHVITYMGTDGRFHAQPTRLAGDVLIWLRGELTLRLEGELTKAEALELARSIR